MSFEKLLYVLLFAWAASCLYYVWKISRITRASGVSVFGASGKMSRTTRTILRRLFLSIVVVTIFFLIVIILAYFVRQSS